MLTTQQPLSAKVDTNFAGKRRSARSVQFARGLRPWSFTLYIPYTRLIYLYMANLSSTFFKPINLYYITRLCLNMSLLSLSFLILTSKLLKKCFTYCSNFSSSFIYKSPYFDDTCHKQLNIFIKLFCIVFRYLYSMVFLYNLNLKQYIFI
jgi:hypothetical protein